MRHIKLFGGLVCCIAVALVGGAPVSAAEVAAGGSLAGNPLAPGGSLAGNPLAPGGAVEALAPSGGEPSSRPLSAEALAEDQRSRSEFAGYGRAAAVALAKRVFGIATPRWAAPQGQASGTITGYVGERDASETLPSGKHLLLASSSPLRSEVGSGSPQPVSLELRSNAGAYEPANPLVPLVISKDPAVGAALPFGLAVAPVQHEAPEAAEVVGHRVFYPGTAKDTDFMLEAMPTGVEAAWQLRSAESPSEEALAFSLPKGASLVMSQSVEGAAEVLLEGHRTALVLPPTAIQANGVGLSASYSVSGSTLVTHVDLAGSVDFPVEVDPAITQGYGGSSGFWEGWNQAGTADAYFEGGQGNWGVLAGVLPNAPASWAAWSLYAPGWSTGEGLLTRVSVSGLMHEGKELSDIEAGITESNGKPGYSWEGGADVEGPLKTGEAFSGAWATFCAQGYSSPGNCWPENGGNYFHMSVFTWASELYRQYAMTEGTTAEFLDNSHLTTDLASGATTSGGHTNALGSSSTWFGPASNTYVEYAAADKAFGVESMTFQRWTGSTWEVLASNNYPAEGGCAGVVCGAERSRELSYNNLSGLPNGENDIEVVSRDPSGIEEYSGQETLRVDKIAPHNLTVTGADVKGETINITEGQAGDQLTVQATDGEGSVRSSGIRSLGIEVGEHQIGGYEGSCSPGPCTAQATWTLNGRELGAGVHELTVTATDNAGNIASQKYILFVHAASPIGMGPGSVNPQSGDFALEKADVDLKDTAGDLTITRHYDSRNVNEGVEGPLGPEWTIGLGQLASLEVLGEAQGKDEGVMVSGPEGLTFFSVKEGGGFEPPPGDSTLSLTQIDSGHAFLLEDKTKGTSTEFTKPEGAKQWMPTVSKVASTTNTLTDSYKSVKLEGGKVEVEPTEELAPHSKAECPSEREKLLADQEQRAEACRALFFYYGEEGATQSKASGDAESQWGWYPYRLSKVVAVVWSTSAGKMEEIPVAEYSYDGQGRLRAEWDPRIKPALKTTYGYDSENHVTAVSPPGREPWMIEYGTIPGDASAGRAVAVARAGVGTPIGVGALPANTTAPALSSSEPKPSTAISVSDGEWSGSPLYYGYQWEDCNAGGLECTPIPGAINSTYTPAEGDGGHTLRAEVIATSAAGTAMATSAITKVVNGRKAPVYYASGMPLGSSLKVTFSGAMQTLYIANPGFESIKCGLVLGTGSIEAGGKGSGSLELKGCRASGSEGCVIPETIPFWTFKTELVYKAGTQELPEPEVSTLFHVERVELVVSNCNHSGTYMVSGTMLAKVGSADSEATTHLMSVQPEWSSGYELGDQSHSTSLSVGSFGRALWGGDWEANAASTWSALPGERIKYPAAGPPPPPATGSNAVTTIEYNVPVKGTGAPYAMGAKEVEAWGQKNDIPAEGAEVFPPEHPQGWPANGHAGATVYYTDDEAQTVNVAAPNEGISTIEYHEGDVVRALSSGNRAKAVKEANPVEAAEKLSTVSKYSPEGNELTEVTGPEHKVKLSSGEEVSTRNHVHYSYDEGAPEGEAYDLVTKTTDGALLANGEEKDLRTTLTGYSGQEGVGWKLREPTSVTTEPRGADLVTSTRYNKETGAVEETRAPGGNAETVVPPTYGSEFGGSGSGDGQFTHPEGVAVDGSGDVWVVDTGNSRIEKFTSTGSFLAAYSSYGTEGKKFSKPAAIAVDREAGDIYVADTDNHRVVELSTSGALVREWGSEGIGNGQFKYPTGVAVDPEGHVWVADVGENRVQEFSATGEFIRVFGSTGTGHGQFEEPGEIAFSGGMVYVTDYKNERVQEFSAQGVYVGQFGGGQGEEGKVYGPWGIVAAPVTGDLYVSESWEGSVSVYSPDGKFLGHLEAWEHLHSPEGMAVNAQGDVYIADRESDQISEWIPVGSGPRMHYRREFGAAGSGEAQFKESDATAVDAEGNVWATDWGNDRIEKFSSTRRFLAAYGSEGSGNGQFHGPTGIGVNQSTGDVYVADRNDSRIEEFSSSGGFIRAFGGEGSEPGKLKDPESLTVDANGNVWVADTFNNRIEEFSSTGSFIVAYGKEGAGNGEYKHPSGIAFYDEHIYVSDSTNHRVQMLTISGEYLAQFGAGLLDTPKGIVADSAGDIFVVDNGDGEVKEFESDGLYLGKFSSYGTGEEQLAHPEGVAINAAGDLYIADTANNRIQEWLPEHQTVHDTKTIYYTPGTEAGVEACESRPQWAGLACRTESAAQPTDANEGLPDLPVTTTEYNMWYEPVKTTEAFGSTTRTRTAVYESERPIEQKLEAGADKPVAPITDKYSATLGVLEEQASNGKTITRKFNTLGQMESYTDAEGNATTYGYDQYGRPVEVDYDASKLDGLEAIQRLHYDETTGAVTELEDLGGEGTYEKRGVGTFKASYGLEGEMLTETYPNGMTATYGYNSIGEGTSLAYLKTNHCTGSECEWFKDSLTPSIHGEAMAQQSSLASEQYRYEQPGRLAEVKETPTAEDCTARIYAYNEEGDRTSLTTRKSGSGECTATEGGEIQRHTYDEANRLTDEEVAYEPLGNVSKLPSADAGGYPLETEYYADGQVESQTQHEKTNTYTLDPEGRTLSTETVGKELASTTIASHYPGPGGSTPSWTYNETTSGWTRNIVSFGGLVAVEESGKQAVLQLRDLEGNIVGTASLNETVGTPHSMERSTEYGVPVSEKPQDKYGWLGTTGVSPELPSGAIVQDGVTYVPQLGAPLQTVAVSTPPVANVVEPFVISVPPFKAVSYEAAQGKSDEGGTPGGNVPEPEGEETPSCTGMKACAASSKRRKTKCFVKAYVDEKGGWVWAHAYAWCPGEKMPRSSFLQACILADDPEGFYDGPLPEPVCGDAVIGEKDPKQLYSHAHEECVSGILYYGEAKFWLSEWLSVHDYISEHAYQCKENTMEATSNFVWVLVEIFESTDREAGTE